jgi:hypothetical protein
VVGTAISATARKIAVIIWNMLVKGVTWNNLAGYFFSDKNLSYAC